MHPLSCDVLGSLCGHLQAPGYPVIMQQQLCIFLVVMAWLSGLANSLLQSSLTIQLPLCGNNKVDDFLCEGPSDDQDVMC